MTVFRSGAQSPGNIAKNTLPSFRPQFLVPYILYGVKKYIMHKNFLGGWHTLLWALLRYFVAFRFLYLLCLICVPPLPGYLLLFFQYLAQGFSFAKKLPISGNDFPIFRFGGVGSHHRHCSSSVLNCIKYRTRWNTFQFWPTIYKSIKFFYFVAHSILQFMVY